MFHKMLHRHSLLIWYLRGIVVTRKGAILKIIARMWEALPSYKIVNTFCLDKRIAKKIVKRKGNNIFLAGAKGEIASGLGR